jgi:hypothetical protein
MKRIGRPREHFRFLDLPREIRDEIYNHALCSFSRRNGPYSIEQYARVHVQAIFENRRFLGNVALLLANKQIHEEGYEYMLKKNLFVRIECRGFAVQEYLHGHAPGIAVLAYNTSSNMYKTATANNYPWYAMRVRMGLDRWLKKETKSHVRRRYRDIVMLWEDCWDFFNRFEVEIAMKYLDNQEMGPLRIKVELGPSNQDQDIGQRDLSGLSTDFFTRNMQKRLLQPIQEGLRGFPSLEIEGCLAEGVAAQPTRTVSRPLWSSSQALHTHLTCQLESAKAALSTGDLTQCAHICATSTEILYRLRRSPSSLDLIINDTPGYAAILAQLNLTFHVLFAKCLHAHLSTPPEQRTFAQESTHIFSTCTAMISILMPSNPPAEPFITEWSPSRYDLAESGYLRSKGIRLSYKHSDIPDSDAPEQALSLIHAAMEYWPENEIIREESRITELWVEKDARYRDWRNANPHLDWRPGDS